MGLTNNLGKLSNMITSTGSAVGIGTSSPSQILSVVNSDNTQNAIASFAANNLTQQVEIWYGGIKMGGTSAGADLNLAAKGNGNMLFSTNSSERFRISSAGHLLIGTSTDLTFYSTWDSGVTRIGRGGILFAYANNDDNFMIAQNYYVNSSNNDVKWATSGSANIFMSSGSMYFRTNPSGSAGSTISWNNPLTLTSGGNVGIGLTNPSYQLSIANQISNGANPVSSYTATSGVNGQNFFNGYYAVNSDGSGTYPRYFDIVSVGQPDGTNGGSNIRFFTNPIATSSPAVERGRFTSNGYFRLASNGIQFNGDTADVNSLDDYEEGTWTPVLAASSGAASYSAQYGWYTKIGRVVTIVWFLEFTKSTLSGGSLRLTNFPFTLLNGGVFYPQGVVLFDNLSTTTNNITLQGANNSTGGDFIGGNGGTTNHVGLPITTLGSGNMNCRGVLTYFT